MSPLMFVKACALFLLVVLASSCRESTTTLSIRDVTLMTFNVENLFDTTDDPDRRDETYLPLQQKRSAEHRALCATVEVEVWRNQCLHWDWSPAVVDTKLERIAAAILQVNGGRGPDIIAFQEVENIAILERLRSEYLGAANYRPAILIEGQDQRGIDVAFLSRLPVSGEPQLHAMRFREFPGSRVRDTRGILQADFQLPDGSILTGFAVHFPAPYHPFAMRELAYDFLNQLRANLPAERSFFAAGDFNTTSKEIAERDTLERKVRPSWQVVHEIGCETCRGTSYFAPDDSWSFLDMILFSSKDWRVRPESVALANQTPEQMTGRNTPARFRLQDLSGVSDHWPLIATISYE